jgi:hypothetical protein
MSNNSTIKCPNCKHEFPIGNALAQEIENDIRAKYLKRYSEDKTKLDAEKAQLERDREQLKLQTQNQEVLLATKLKEASVKIEQEAIKKAAGEMQLQLEMLNKELTDKSTKLKESQKKELELLQKEKQINEKAESLELDLAKKMLEREKEIIEKAQKIESEKSLLKVKELEKKIADQNELVETMKRKAEQGSMQMQGEVQELALEELLRSTFPFDTIEEIAKGTKGADCVQVVRNNVAKECGKIIYESKRTKAFANEWIEKLKTDMRSKQADIAVIVTETLPKDMDSFGFKDGVWICEFSDVKPLSFLLRDSLIKINTALISQENKGDKMQLLYNFLTSNEFKQNMDAIAEGFMGLREGILKERMQMEKIWKEREKQLDKVLLNTSQFYGSIQGIAGSAIGDLKMLE